MQGDGIPNQTHHTMLSLVHHQEDLALEKLRAFVTCNIPMDPEEESSKLEYRVSY